MAAAAKTGSAASTGLAFAIGFIPYLLLSLPAGAWADRLSRSKMMIWADIGRVALMSTLPVAFFISGETPVLLLFAVQAGLSAFAALFDAAYGAYLPLIVDKDKLGSANSAMQSGTSLSQILGPVLGGAFVSWFGGSEVLMLTAATYLISIVSIMKVRRSERQQTRTAQKRRLLTEIGEGFAYVWNHKLIRTTGIFSMLANLVIPATYVALLYKLQRELHVASDVTGYVLASWSAGMVAGGLVYGRIKALLSLKQLLVAVLVLWMIPPAVLAATSHTGLIAAAYGLSGFAVSVWNIALITLRQTSVAPDIMGRAMTSIRLVAWCSLPVGNIVGGAVTQAQGTTAVFAIDVAVRIAMLLLSAFMFKQMNQPAANEDEPAQPLKPAS
ncbi:MFS transporter [Gordoniibacillus kamchatkensis]|uniref:MFS transporter n=1 Tax=Gordoniibacillus kamchatkensis TaxID=1590651 RepID=UPI002F426311